MLSKHITTIAFQMGSCIPRTLSNSTATLSNNYYRRQFNERFNKMKKFSSPINSSYKKKWTHHLKNMFSRTATIFCTTTENTQKSTENENNIVEEDKETQEQKKLHSLQKENDILKDKYQRALADRENTRRRLMKEIGDAKIFGIQSFCKDLLEVSDIFKKALENIPQESIKNSDTKIKDFYEGIVMTENKLHVVFDRHGLEQYLPDVGDKFDPSLQEAMLKIEVKDGKQSGTVADVFRTGWKLRDRCIRSAQVSVFKDS